MHLVGETCCNYGDCNCTKNIAGKRIEGIAVTNPDNLAPSVIASVNEKVLASLGELSSEELATVKAGVSEVRIVAGGGSASYSSSGGGKFIIKIPAASVGTYHEQVRNAFSNFASGNYTLTQVQQAKGYAMVAGNFPAEGATNASHRGNAA